MKVVLMGATRYGEPARPVNLNPPRGTGTFEIDPGRRLLTTGPHAADPGTVRRSPRRADRPAVAEGPGRRPAEGPPARHPAAGPGGPVERLRYPRRRPAGRANLRAPDRVRDGRRPR